MSDLYFRKKIITLELESTYNTDPTPVAADAIQTSNLRIKPYGGPRVSRDLDRIVVGAQEEINTAPNTEITFDAEIVGSGTAGTAPNIDKALQSCGLNATVVAATSVTYAPVDPEDIESCTIYFYLDGQIHKISGCRGTWSLNLSAGQIPRYSFRFLGLFTAPVAGSLVTPTFTASGVAIPVTKTNTPTATLDSAAIAFRTLSIDGGNELIHDNIPNRNEVFVPDRNITGNLEMLAQNIGTKNWLSLVRSDAGVSKVALNVVHGTTAGNIVTINGPKVQLLDIDYPDQNKRVGMSFPMKFIPNSGNDEITIAYT